MDLLALIPVFLVGLAGSVHCAAMCGGIVGAFSAAPAAPARTIPIAVAQPADALTRALAYNTGRIASYMAAGALAGGLAGGVRTLAGAVPLQAGAFWLANLMLVALGLHLMDAWRGLNRLEGLGQGLWRRLRPAMGLLLPLDHPAKYLALGALWGWLPCAMVYSVLATAMFAGSAGAGAAIMLAFGLGTLPALLAMGLLGARLQRPAMRRAAGLLVLGFGVLGLARAAAGVPAGWMEALCLP